MHSRLLGYPEAASGLSKKPHLSEMAFGVHALSLPSSSCSSLSSWLMEVQAKSEQAGEHVHYVSKLQAKHKESSANQTTMEKQVEEIGKSWRLRALFVI